MKLALPKIIATILILSGLGILAAAIFYALEPEMASLKIRLIFLALLTADAICYFIAAWGVQRSIKRLYFWTLALLSINFIALIFDDTGVIDLTVAGLNLLLLVMVILNFKLNKPNNEKRK